MRCPKCRYISFERVERCRNCGYDFSFAPAAPDPELPLRDPETEAAGPLADFSLEDSQAAVASAGGLASARTVAASRTDLPLFEPSTERWRGTAGQPRDERPIVSPTPRAPLGVRRSAGALARAPVVSPREAARLALEPASRERSDPALQSDDGLVPAGAFRRLLAALIDVTLVISIDLGVLYFTLRLCGLTLDGLLVIPVVPFVGFLLLLNGGYFAGFTAACGQTIGKMAAGIRVVAAPEGDPGSGARVTFGFAALRTVAYLASALPAGLGFAPAFFGRERRALHDRLAETSVIKVPTIG